MDNPLNLAKLKNMFHNGISSISKDPNADEAVIVIGDTGVGKSTIVAFLSGAELFVRYDGLKQTLECLNNPYIKIGHENYSQTSIPNKIVIDGTAFYDCPGFRDNKGQQYEISKSFFVQRLLDIYPKVKIVLMIDESQISQARADKLPRLTKNRFTVRAIRTKLLEVSCKQQSYSVIQAAIEKTVLQNYEQLKILVGLGGNVKEEKQLSHDENMLLALVARDNKIIGEVQRMGEKIQVLQQENQFLCVKVSETELESKANHEQREIITNSLLMMEYNNMNFEKQIEIEKSLVAIENKLKEALEVSVKEGEILQFITGGLLCERAKLLNSKYHHFFCLEKENSCAVDLGLFDC